MGLLVISAPAAWGFTPSGPLTGTGSEAWQIVDLGFNKTWVVDNVGPKNLGVEYRRNTPVMYYACDASFLDYFGSGGLAAIDQAFAAYNLLSNVDIYSSDLHEVPMETTRDNLLAATLGISDVKSSTMAALAESLGLADSVRYIWNLHDRTTIPGSTATCPFNMLYLVVERNFDPVIGLGATQQKPTAYVNGVFYDYQIHDYCTLPPGVQDSLSEALEVTVDPDAGLHFPVASGMDQLLAGSYYTGLTFDDIGGLRYLISANNMNVEGIAPGAQLMVTNPTPQALFTSNLTLFAMEALTNDAAAMIALYPTLVDTSIAVDVLPVWTTNVTGYYSNAPWAPTGYPILVLQTNVVFTTVTVYQHSFGNVFVVSNVAPNSWVVLPLTTIPTNTVSVVSTIQTVSITNAVSPYSPPGSVPPLTTNTSTSHILTDVLTGDFFIGTPANFSCGSAITAVLETNLAPITNVLVSITNIGIATNTTTAGATNVQSYTVNLIIPATNHVYLVHSIDCVADTPALRQGIEKITFIRRDYDSLLSRTYIPITNQYPINMVSNFAIVPQLVRRVVTAPDFLITATDLSPGPNALRVVNSLARTVPLWDTASTPAGDVGPGVIDPGATITFNTSAPIFGNDFAIVNTNAFLLNDANMIPWYIWGSFDGTTNPVVTYPSGFSIEDLESQVLVQVSPQTLPDGGEGSAYSATLTTQAASSNSNWWQAPYTWTLATGSPGLPLGLNPGDPGSGTIFGTPQQDGTFTISGTPQQEGTFDFMLQVTDSQGHSVVRSFSITINP
jgi:hypothetical protein